MNKQAQYNQDRIEGFARETLGISDPATIGKITQAYRKWYFERERSRVYVNPDSKPDEVDLCLLVRVGGTDANPHNVYASLNKTTGLFVLRRQHIHNERLQSMTPIQVATLTQGSNFGLSEDGRHGRYMYRSVNSVYGESAFYHLRDVIHEAGYSSGEDLTRVIAEIAGHWDRESDGSGYYDNYYHLYDDIREHARAVERHAIRKSFKEFVSHLDPNALKVLVRSRMPNAFYYSWLVGRRDCEPGKEVPVAGPEAVRNRREAAYAFPVLLPTMVQNRDFTEMIDAGGSLIEIVRDFVSKKAAGWGEDKFEVPKEAVKWLLGKKPCLVDGFNCGSNPRIYHMVSDLRWLSVLPREWRPRNVREYGGYDHIFFYMRDYAWLTGRPVGELFRELVSALNKPGGLPKFEEKDRDENGNETGEKPTLKPMFEVARPVQAMVVANVEDSGSPFSMDGNVKDFLKRVGEQIILPELYYRLVKAGVSINGLFQEEKDWHDCDPLDSRAKAGLLSRHVFKGLSVIKVLAASARWHRNAARLENRTGYIAKDITWHPVIEPVTAPGGVRISALSSTRQLLDMADKMGNCVGGYSYQCAVGTSHVLELSAEDGSWTTNLEIRDSDNGRNGTRSVSEVQHEMPSGEKTIPEEAAKAAAWLVENINSGAVQCDWEAVDRIRAEHRKDAILMKIGFDPLSFEARERAYEAWHGTMPALFPRSDRLAFMEELGISDAMDKIVAGYAQPASPGKQSPLECVVN